MSWVTRYGYPGIFSLLTLGVALLVPRRHGGLYLAFILFAAGMAALNAFYLRYFRSLASTR